MKNWGYYEWVNGKWIEIPEETRRNLENAEDIDDQDTVDDDIEDTCVFP